MPPPKAKLHKNTGRLKNINSSHGNSMLSGNREHQVVTNTLNSRSNTRNEVSASGNNSAESPAIEQFELELYWCIQTLENSLNSGKLNAKQVQDAEKTLKSLKSGNQPVVKKRQLMSSTFGDYRKKMVDEEKKLRVGNTSIQFVEAPSKDHSSSANKGHFVKKSFTTSLGDNSNFQFNFPIDAMENLSIKISTAENGDKSYESSGAKVTGKDKAQVEISTHRIENDTQIASRTNSAATVHQPSNPFIKSKLTTSDNSFKFNFSIE